MQIEPPFFAFFLSGDSCCLVFWGFRLGGRLVTGWVNLLHCAGVLDR